MTDSSNGSLGHWVKENTVGNWVSTEVVGSGSFGSWEGVVGSSEVSWSHPLHPLEEEVSKLGRVNSHSWGNGGVLSLELPSALDLTVESFSCFNINFSTSLED